MILGIEVMITFYGIVMLFRGKGIGKDAVYHKYYRFLGAILLTLIPVALCAVVIFGVIWALNHPGLSAKELEDSVHWPATGVEAAVAVIYVIIATVGDSKIKRKALAEHGSDEAMPHQS